MRLAAPLLLGLALLAQPAAAQFESREAIGLQNQILQLRQELEQLRARGGGSAVAPPVPRGGAGNEMVGQLLDRVSSMEEETRRLRGRVNELDNRNRRLQADLTKLTEDMEYRLNQREGAATPPPGRPTPTLAVPAPGRPSAPTAPVVPPVAAPVAAPAHARTRPGGRPGRAGPARLPGRRSRGARGAGRPRRRAAGQCAAAAGRRAGRPTRFRQRRHRL